MRQPGDAADATERKYKDVAIAEQPRRLQGIAISAARHNRLAVMRRRLPR
jgi:hypothetical protein